MLHHGFSESDLMGSSHINQNKLMRINRKSVTFNEDVLVLLIPSRKDSKMIFTLENNNNNFESSSSKTQVTQQKECEISENYIVKVHKRVRFRDTVQVILIKPRKASSPTVALPDL
jgi:hypothetical protein